MNTIPLARKDFQRIIQFYLFETPVRTYERSGKKGGPVTKDQPDPKYNYLFKKVSKRGITFADRNLDGSKLNSLRAAMARVSNVKFIVVDDYAEVMKAASSFDEDTEYLVIKRNYENVSVTEGYFYFIRNAFAHGDFDVDGKIYTLKNEKNGNVKGMARIKEDSLLAWIDLVNMDAEDIKKAGRKK